MKSPTLNEIETLRGDELGHLTPGERGYWELVIIITNNLANLEIEKDWPEGLHWADVLDKHIFRALRGLNERWQMAVGMSLESAEELASKEGHNP